MLRTLYVVADIFITEVRRTSQRVRIRIHMFTPPNKCIFFSSASFVLISVIALPTAYSVYILHYNLRVHTNVYDFLAFFVPCVLLFSYFLLPYPGMVTASCSCCFVCAVPGAATCQLSVGGCTINMSSVNCKEQVQKNEKKHHHQNLYAYMYICMLPGTRYEGHV